MQTSELEELVKLRALAEWALMEKRGDADEWRRVWRARDRQHRRWQAPLAAQLSRLDSTLQLNNAVKVAQDAWGGRFLRKARKKPPSSSEVQAALSGPTTAPKGAVAAYVGLANQTGEDAGQGTLDALGINETFAWAHPRDMARDPFAVRGSKIIAQLYDNHIARLAAIVVRKCDPAQPKTMGQLIKEIRAEFKGVSARDARRVARTESAFVWETTNWNTMVLNGVREIEWLIASGPSIGPPKSYPVCEHCLGKAAHSPYSVDDLLEIPPIHPNDRCTLVQSYDPEWLPPATPWTGEKEDLVTFGD